MKLDQIDHFLTRGTATTSANGSVAVGIHPSSEVDLVDVGGALLGVGGIVMVDPASTPQLKSVRRPTGPLTLRGIGARVSRDGLEYPGEKLVLQLYEACDVLVPPGPRHPVYRLTLVATDAAAVTAANALLAFRLPMQGRKHAAISFWADDGTDFSVTIVGHRLGYMDKPDTACFTQDPVSPYTWFNGGLAPALDVASIDEARTIHIGGHGDDLESFDELSVWVHGGNPLGSGSIVIMGEADGERG